MNAPLFLSPADNELVCALVVARLVAARRLAPRGHRMTSAGGLAFTTAVRMVYRVHGHAAIDRLFAQPDVASGLADVNVLVLHVADLPDRRHPIDEHFARLARGQLHQRVLFFFRAEPPAERTICAPLPGLSSMFWMVVPAGMSFSGSAFPTRMSASGPLTIFWPTFNPTG